MKVLRRTLLAAAWTLGVGRARADSANTSCWGASFEGDGFTVCRYAAGRDALKLANLGADGTPLGGLAALARALGVDARRVRFAMNGGMYDPAQRPVGLYVEDGRTLKTLERSDGQGNFYLKPNGVFWTDAAGAPHVTETEAFAASGVRPAWATQSGPLLVQGGRLSPAISPNGPSLLVRNAVGVKAGEALFAISDGKVSFGRIARFLCDGLGCADVLFLDGTISSLWAPGLGRRDARTGLGTFVVVLAPS